MYFMNGLLMGGLELLSRLVKMSTGVDKTAREKRQKEEEK